MTDEELIKDANACIDAMAALGRFPTAQVVFTDVLKRFAALEKAARNSAMYLSTGFIECSRCGDEVETKNTDAEYELRAALTSDTHNHREEGEFGGGATVRRSPVVAKGQTPLDAGLRHPLLDVINEGSKARDTGATSPYHGHSLEHCLHATGWVQRDLRLALNDANKRIKELEAKP